MEKRTVYSFTEYEEDCNERDFELCLVTTMISCKKELREYFDSEMLKDSDEGKFIDEYYDEIVVVLSTNEGSTDIYILK